MARDFNGSTQYLSRTDALLNTHPLTISAWFNCDNDALVQTIFGIGSSSSVTPLILLEALGDTGGDPIRLLVRDDSGNLQNAQTSTGYSLTTWHHACGVWAAADDTRAFIDGGSKGTDTAPTLGTLTVNRTAIAVWDTTGLNNYFNGRIAEVGLWNVALTDDEVAVLAAGYSPLLVRPQSLVAYWPIASRQSPEIDLIGGYNMTLTNSPTIANHPSVLYTEKKALVPLFSHPPSRFNERMILSLRPQFGIPTATNYATLGLRNRFPVLQFDDTADESIVFSPLMPQAYNSGDIKLILRTSGATAISGAAKVSVALERIGDGQQDIDSDGFTDYHGQVVSIPAISGHVNDTEVKFSSGVDMDSIVAGEKFRVKVTRFGSDGNDDMSGDLELHNIDLVEVA
jgi:hypothetical protein